MANKWQKSIKSLYNSDTGSASADKIVMCGDGSVKVMNSYYFRHNNTATKWAAQVAGDLTGAGIAFGDIIPDDRFARWPKDSYFIATVQPKV